MKALALAHLSLLLLTAQSRELEQTLRQAEALLGESRLDEALAKFRAVTRMGDIAGAGRYGEGLVWLAKKNYVEALPHLTSAVAANPKNPDRLFTLAAAELQLKQFHPARKHFVELKALTDGNPVVAYRIGTLLREHARLKDAEAEFNEIADLLQPSGAAARYPELSLSDVFLQIAQLRFARFDYLGGLEYLERIQPDGFAPRVRAAVLDLYGLGLLALGRIPEARDKYRQATLANPSLPDYFVHLAWAETLAGNASAAQAILSAARDKWPGALDIQKALAIAERESAPLRASVPFSDDWHLRGEGIVCCPCATPCPCRSNGPPTRGHCENTGVFHIANGHYGKIRLDDLTFAAAGCTMGPQNLPSALYVQAATDEEQIVALEKLYQRFVPIRPMVFSSVQRVELTLHSANELYEATIPGVLQMKIRRTFLFRTAAQDYFANSIEYARNLLYRMNDTQNGLKWEYSGRQANFRTYELDASDYTSGKMLIQFADGSGRFNEKQLAVIKALNLRVRNSAQRTHKK
jgi:Flp pilus assembly protein TadD